MHNAPSVSYPVGRCAFQRWLLWGLTLLASAVLIAWLWGQGVTWLWFVGFAATAVGLWQGWLSLGHQGSLTWDGQVWCLHGQGETFDDALGEVQVILDVQKALLLRWEPASDTLRVKSQWLWLDAQHANERWQDLRRAVYQRSES